MLLQVDGVGGDDDAGAVAQGVAGGGRQVGQRLAGAGAGLHDQALAGVERFGHLAGHRRLLLAPLEAGEELRLLDRPLEHRRHLGRRHGDGRRPGDQRLAELPGQDNLFPGGPRLPEQRRLLEHLGEKPLQRPLRRGGDALELDEGLGGQVRQPRAQAQEDLTRRLGVGEGAMALRERHVQVGRQRAQAVIGEAVQQEGGEVPGVEDGAGRRDPLRGEKAEVERYVLADHRQVRQERLELRGDLGEQRRVPKIVGLDAGQALDEVRERRPRLDQLVEGLQLALRRELHRPDLDDLAGFGVEAGGLQVQGDVGGGHQSPAGSRASGRTGRRHQESTVEAGSRVKRRSFPSMSPSAG